MNLTVIAAASYIITISIKIEVICNR